MPTKKELKEQAINVAKSLDNYYRSFYQLEEGVPGKVFHQCAYQGMCHMIAVLGGEWSRDKDTNKHFVFLNGQNSLED